LLPAHDLCFRNAAVVIASIELMDHIRKVQFDLPLNSKDIAAAAVWNALLST
jgi:hypothetical protein